ncbi:MAG: hypothetical protein AB7R00_10610, partial [Kofleriaceae bacterium]
APASSLLATVAKLGIETAPSGPSAAVRATAATTVDDEQSFLAVSIAPASSLLATVAELGSEAEAICPSAAVKRKPLPPPTTSSRSTRDLYSR